MARTAEESDETTRVEAFSDGIFAIAMTLLVLEIRLPHEGPLSEGLLQLWPSYLAFLTSFATIGVMWVNHHRLFNLIQRTDQGLLGLNLLLLLGVTFLPFPTAVVAQAIRSADARLAAMFYNGVFIVIAICWGVLWRYASHDRRLLGDDVDDGSVRGISRQYALGPVYYMVAFVVAVFSPVASVALNLLLALFFAIPARAFHRQSMNP
jgi:uncharacterized membrane protein